MINDEWWIINDEWWIINVEFWITKMNKEWWMKCKNRPMIDVNAKVGWMNK